MTSCDHEAAYFGQTQPARRILGVDPDQRRIAMAQRVSSSLGLDNRSSARTALSFR